MHEPAGDAAVNLLARSARARAASPALTRDAFDLMCLSAAIVLVAHVPHLSPWLSGGLALMLAWRWWQRRQRSGGAPAWLKLPILALLVLAVTASNANPLGQQAGASFAIGLLVMKLLESETTRDARVAMGFACFTLMTALLFDQGLLATVFIALGLLPTLATLRALEPAQLRTSLPRTLLPALSLLAAALPLALFAFVLVPRLNGPLWGTPSSHASVTGLSDSMSPSEFGELLLDDSPALRVAFDDAPPPNNQRYFRAYVLWDYDGRRWSSPDPGDEAAAPVEVAATTSYRVSLEPSRQRALPALDLPIEAPAHAQLLADHQLLADRPVNDPLEYRVRSALRYHLQPSLSADARQRALRLPGGFNPRTQALATQWRQRYGSDDGAIAQAALSLFHDGGFRYTLAPAELGREAMDDFLFTTHEGFCEQYASAFTVLMRAAGIPSRVVTGYQGGYWNTLGNYLLVRQSDAHAWSEIWLAGRGWVRIDPTAAVRPERISLGAYAAAEDQQTWYRSDWLESMRNHWDIVNRWWNEGVIGFDTMSQRGLLTPFGIHDLDGTALGALLVVGSALFAALGLAWAMARRDKIDPALAWMRVLEHKLDRHGVTRRPGEGPQHYLSRAARALPARRDALKALSESYLECRYAHAEPSPESVRAFRRLVRDFKVRGVVK